MKRFQIVADRMVVAYNAGDFAGMRSDFDPTLEKALTLEKAKDFFAGLSAEHGKIKKLGAARMTPPDQAVFPVFFERGALDMRIVLDGRDRVAGLMFVPHTPELPVPEKHAAVLDLPFKGEIISAH